MKLATSQSIRRPQQKQEARNQVKAAVSNAVVAKMQEIGLVGTLSSVDITSEAYAQGGAMAFIARAKAIGTKNGQPASRSFEVFGRTTSGGGLRRIIGKGYVHWRGGRAPSVDR